MPFDNACKLLVRKVFPARVETIGQIEAEAFRTFRKEAEAKGVTWRAVATDAFGGLLAFAFIVLLPLCLTAGL